MHCKIASMTKMRSAKKRCCVNTFYSCWKHTTRTGLFMVANGREISVYALKLYVSLSLSEHRENYLEAKFHNSPSRFSNLLDGVASPPHLTRCLVPFSRAKRPSLVFSLVAKVEMSHRNLPSFYWLVVKGLLKQKIKDLLRDTLSISVHA